MSLIAAAAVLGAAPAASAPPAAGVLVPGVSLGGVELEMTKGDVQRIWGTRYGACRSCGRTTWYFNSRAFAPEGAGVVFRRDRVEHVFTLWKPDGWRVAGGLELGASAGAVEDAAPIDERIECGDYAALLDRHATATTVYYLYRDELWGFGLVRRDQTPCL